MQRKIVYKRQTTFGSDFLVTLSPNKPVAASVALDLVGAGIEDFFQRKRKKIMLKPSKSIKKIRFHQKHFYYILSNGMLFQNVIFTFLGANGPSELKRSTDGFSSGVPNRTSSSSNSDFVLCFVCNIIKNIKIYVVIKMISNDKFQTV